jgi:hypothetical protein
MIGSIALLSLQEKKNSSQRVEALLNRQSSDRKLIETHVLSSNGESLSVQVFQVLL